MRFGTNQELPNMLWHTKSHLDPKRNDRDKGLGPFHRAKGFLQMGFQKWTFLWHSFWHSKLIFWYVRAQCIYPKSHYYPFGHGKAPKMINVVYFIGFDCIQNKYLFTPCVKKIKRQELTLRLNNPNSAVFWESLEKDQEFHNFKNGVYFWYFWKHTVPSPEITFMVKHSVVW